MKTSKIVQAAEAAKADGFEYMTSVITTYHRTNYYHVVSIDRVLNAGRWIPAGRYGREHRLGVTLASVPDKSISKAEAIKRYC